MSAEPPAGATPGLDAAMFYGSPRLRPGLALLRALPGPVARGALVAGAVVDGILRRGRYRRAVAWARAQGYGWTGARRIALALLATHGRFAAEEAMLGSDRVEDLGGRVTVDGLEHLERACGGVLLLGFHLGPPRTWLMLRALGLPVRMVARFEQARHDPRWEGLVRSGEVLPLPEHDSAQRLRSLYRIRTLLAQDATIFMTADGPFGKEAFRLDLPGMPLVVRSGWWALRRQTRVPTCPVLAYETGGRRVIRVHAPLPPVQADVDADVAACRDALTPIVADYVRRFPTQCRYLVFPRWASEALSPKDPD